MSSNKKTTSKFNFVIICIIGFVVSILFEFYFISYFPYDYFMLFGTGIIMCIFGYLSIDGVLEIIHQTSQKRDEQNEIMIKASKAIYLTTKKIALNSSHSMPDALETPKDISSLIDDLSQANERLAKEVENAVSLQSLVQKNRSIVNNAREIIEEHEQPLSPLEVEKDLKLDEAISETDFETMTKPETIDSMIKQEVSIQEASSIEDIQKEPAPETLIAAEILEETIESVGNIMKENSETISDTQNLTASKSDLENVTLSETISDTQPQPELEDTSETASDIFSEVKETASQILNNSLENGSTIKDTIITNENPMTNDSTLENNSIIDDSSVESNIMANENFIDNNNMSAENSVENNMITNTTAVENGSTENTAAENNMAEENSRNPENNIAAENNEIQQNSTMSEPQTPPAQSTFSANSSQAPSSDDKPMTSEEIAALFANL